MCNTPNLDLVSINVYTKLFMCIKPSLSERSLISWKRSILFCISYTLFECFQEKRDRKRQENKTNKKHRVVIHRQSENHTITSEYVTAQDTKTISVQNNRKFILGIKYMTILHIVHVFY